MNKAEVPAEEVGLFDETFFLYFEETDLCRRAHLAGWACWYVVESRVASVSHLQRRMRLGYSRAARIMDMLEADGIVGPGDGSKPREILVDKDYFDEVDRQLR